MKNIILDVKNLKKSYKKYEVLKGVNLTLCEGEKTALIGVNGSGKTTFLEILCGVKRQDSGTVIKPHKNQIGYMPQNFSLFQDLTVKENLGYLCVIYNLDNSEIENVMKICYLKEKENILAKDLSGGYKQLLSLASAIIFKPKLLILDEPTSAMDPLFRESFQKIISKFMKNGGTVLLTTHYMEEINFCDKVAILSGGQIVYCDSVKNTFSSQKYENASKLIFEYTKVESYEK